MLTTALAFSGGKDSWACLWLNKERLKDIVVLWVDTGKNYPEVLETIEQAKQLCPNFVTIKSDRAAQNAISGLPSSVVPINWTNLGQSVSTSKEVTIQSYLGCCFENIAEPLVKYCHENGIQEMICGQKNADMHRATSKDGDIVFGVKRLHPLEQWTTEMVIEFVSQYMKLPSHFQFKHSSMDCYDCTAYEAEITDLVQYSKEKHPELYEQYKARKTRLNEALAESLEGIV